MINGNKFIALEGIDGSGKTTVCQILSKKINAEVYKTPSWPFSDLRDVIDKNVDIKSRFFFYLSSVIHASSEIARLLNHKHVVCDRYILSTLCYHRASESFFKSFDGNQVDILQPDFTFFLNADYEIRMKRIAIRENSDNSDILNSDLHDKQYQDKVELEFSKYNNLLWINTNDISPEDIADIICNKLARKQEIE
jgi:dTMP kinase